MALLHSTGSKNAKAGLVASVTGQILGDTFAFVDGGASADSITDSGNGFVTAGFQVGDKLKVITVSGVNDGEYTAISVAAGTITVATGSLTAELAAAVGYASIAAARGGSLRDIYDFGVMYLYSGSRPASGDLIETGSVLAVITNNGATFTPGTKDAAGLRFGDASSGAIAPLSGQVWKTDACLATGTIGYGVLYSNARVQGASTTSVRVYFTVGISGSGADMILSTTSATEGAPFTVSSATWTAS